MTEEWAPLPDDPQRLLESLQLLSQYPSFKPDQIQKCLSIDQNPWVSALKCFYHFVPTQELVRPSLPSVSRFESALWSSVLQQSLTREEQVQNALAILRYLYNQLEKGENPEASRQWIKGILEGRKFSVPEKERIARFLRSHTALQGEPIAEGSFGQVYASENKNTAFKVLQTSGDDVLLEELGKALSEGALGTELFHPHILHFTDILSHTGDGKQTIFQMPLYQEFTLLQEANPQQLLQGMTDLVCAVKALHDAGWLHLDIKPENILVDPQTLSVFLGDLGSVLPIGVEGIGLFGSPGFIRTMKDVKKPSISTDLYALLVTLLKLLVEHSLQQEVSIQFLTMPLYFGHFSHFYLPAPLPPATSSSSSSSDIKGDIKGKIKIGVNQLEPWARPLFQRLSQLLEGTETDKTTIADIQQSLDATAHDLKLTLVKQCPPVDQSQSLKSVLEDFSLQDPSTKEAYFQTLTNRYQGDPDEDVLAELAKASLDLALEQEDEEPLWPLTSPPSSPPLSPLSSSLSFI